MLHTCTSIYLTPALFFLVIFKHINTKLTNTVCLLICCVQMNQNIEKQQYVENNI
jgi:hypothetical protein